MSNFKPLPLGRNNILILELLMYTSINNYLLLIINMLETKLCKN